MASARRRALRASLEATCVTSATGEVIEGGEPNYLVGYARVSTAQQDLDPTSVLIWEPKHLGLRGKSMIPMPVRDVLLAAVSHTATDGLNATQPGGANCLGAAWIG